MRRDAAVQVCNVDPPLETVGEAPISSSALTWTLRSKQLAKLLLIAAHYQLLQRVMGFQRRRPTTYWPHHFVRQGPRRRCWKPMAAKRGGCYGMMISLLSLKVRMPKAEVV